MYRLTIFIFAVPNKATPGALFNTWCAAFPGPLMLPIIPRLFQIGFTYAQPFLVTEAIALANTPQQQPFTNIGYGLIGAYILVYFGIAVSFIHQHHPFFWLILVGI